MNASSIDQYAELGWLSRYKDTGTTAVEKQLSLPLGGILLAFAVIVCIRT